MNCRLFLKPSKIKVSCCHILCTLKDNFTSSTQQNFPRTHQTNIKNIIKLTWQFIPQLFQNFNVPDKIQRVSVFASFRCYNNYFNPVSNFCCLINNLRCVSNIAIRFKLIFSKCSSQFPHFTTDPTNMKTLKCVRSSAGKRSVATGNSQVNKHFT